MYFLLCLVFTIVYAEDSPPLKKVAGSALRYIREERLGEKSETVGSVAPPSSPLDLRSTSLVMPLAPRRTFMSKPPLPPIPSATEKQTPFEAPFVQSSTIDTIPPSAPEVKPSIPFRLMIPRIHLNTFELEDEKESV